MTNPTTASHPRRLGRSILAIFLGFITVVVLSLGTDEVFHLLRVYPPWSQPMNDPGLNLLALSYRIIYTVLGSYIAARLAEAMHDSAIRVSLAARLDGLDPDGLRSVVDMLRDRMGPGIICLGSAVDGKVNLIAAVSKALSAKYPAGKLIQEIAKQVGGGGGGRPDLAQAGGKDPSKLDAALALVPGWVERVARG